MKSPNVKPSRPRIFLVEEKSELCVKIIQAAVGYMESVGIVLPDKQTEILLYVLDDIKKTIKTPYFTHEELDASPDDEEEGDDDDQEVAQEVTDIHSDEEDQGSASHIDDLEQLTAECEELGPTLPSTAFQVRPSPAASVISTNIDTTGNNVARTVSATGRGVHTRFLYPADAVVSSLTPASAPEATTSSSTSNTILAGTSNSTKKKNHHKRKEGNPDNSDSGYESHKTNKVSASPSKKRAREEEVAEAARHLRPRIARPDPVSRPSTSNSSPAGQPSRFTHTNPEFDGKPYNHFIPQPRQRPQGLRREGGFYHKSHFDVFWDPSFGDRDRPPTTIQETRPSWHRDRLANPSDNRAGPGSLVACLAAAAASNVGPSAPSTTPASTSAANPIDGHSAFEGSSSGITLASAAVAVTAVSPVPSAAAPHIPAQATSSAAASIMSPPASPAASVSSAGTTIESPGHSTRRRSKRKTRNSAHAGDKPSVMRALDYWKKSD